MRKNTFLKSLIVENGMVKLFHYSDKKIDSGFIQVNKPYNIHSKNEFMVWGKSRSFFYTNEDDYKYDKGVKPIYQYICYIPINDIYPINDNPYKYKKLEEDLNQFDSYFKQSWEDGFTAWGYFLGGNKNVPIVVSFIDLPISESFKISKGGLRIPMDDNELDYIIGDITIGDEKYFVIQKGGYPTTLLNCYLSDEKNIKKAMKGYQKTLEVYMWDDLSLKEEFIDDYIKDLKKSKLWRKRLSEGLSDKIKSRAINQEKQAIEYYSKKIKEGEYFIPVEVFNKLPNEIKEIYFLNKINDKTFFVLTNDEFNSLSDEVKNKFLNLRIEQKGFINDNQFNFLNDDLKKEYIENRLKIFKPDGYLSNYQKEWYKKNLKELFNLNEANIIKNLPNDLLDEGKYLYHFTETYLLDDIKEEGLKPNRNPNYNGVNGVFLTNHLDVYRTNLPQRIIELLDDYYDNPDDYEEKPVVRLKIDASKLDFNKFEPDDDYTLNLYGWNKSANSDEDKIIESLDKWGSVAYTDIIPPNLIKDFSFDF